MKKLMLVAALWFAAAGVAGKATSADKAMDEKKAFAATKADTKAAAADTKAMTKASAPKAGGLMVNINSASEDQLKALKGIGATRAKDIIDYRKKNGDFKTIEDLEKVKGVGPGTMKQIRANIAVSGETVIPKKPESAAKPTKASAMKDEKAKDTKAGAMKDEKAKDTKDSKSAK